MTRVVVNGELEAPPELVGVQDVTALLDVQLKVDGFQFDSSLMEHPEFLLSTAVTFSCRQHGGRKLRVRWRVYRSFQEFQTLDAQLRQAFPLEMQHPALRHPPRAHRRRTFFRMHRSNKFLTKRCAELNGYLARLLQSSYMRLSRFLDPRAPLILRHFCNFDAGFTRGRISFCQDEIDPCGFCLEPHAHKSQKQTDKLKRFQRSHGRASEELDAPPPIYTRYDLANATDRQPGHQDVANEKAHKGDELAQRMMQENRSSSGETTDSKLDELQANLLDDRARNMAMCLKFACACQFSTFQATRNKMQRILRLRGFKETCCPPTEAHTGLSALFCVITRLQEFNDLDKRLFEALTGFPTPPPSSTHIMVAPPHPKTAEAPVASLSKMSGLATTSLATADMTSEQTQIMIVVDLMRQTLAGYALLHVLDLERHFKIPAVDLKKKLHNFKSKPDSRIGAVELAVLATMLNLSILLITNDHKGTVHEILPLKGLRPIRRGARISLVLGYILPTLYCVSGFYLLAGKDDTRIGGSRLSSSSRTSIDRPEFMDLVPASPRVRRTMWLGVDEMDRCFMAEIDAVLEEGSAALPQNSFNFDAADALNRAILDAVWEDCQHNPSLFHLFQRQARQFGQRRISAGFYVQYLEVAFGMDGMAYLVDFLLHVLPEDVLRRQLLRARWRRVRRQISKRVCP